MNKDFLAHFLTVSYAASKKQPILSGCFFEAASGR